MRRRVCGAVVVVVAAAMLAGCGAAGAPGTTPSGEAGASAHPSLAPKPSDLAAWAETRIPEMATGGAAYVVRISATLVPDMDVALALSRESVKANGTAIPSPAPVDSTLAIACLTDERSTLTVTVTAGENASAIAPATHTIPCSPASDPTAELAVSIDVPAGFSATVRAEREASIVYSVTPASGTPQS